MLRCLTHPEEPPEETVDTLSSRSCPGGLRPESGRLGTWAGRARRSACASQRCRCRRPGADGGEVPSDPGLGWCRTSVRHKVLGSCECAGTRRRSNGTRSERCNTGSAAGGSPVFAATAVCGARAVAAAPHAVAPRTRAASAAARPDFGDLNRVVRGRAATGGPGEQRSDQPAMWSSMPSSVSSARPPAQRPHGLTTAGSAGRRSRADRGVLLLQPWWTATTGENPEGADAAPVLRDPTGMFGPGRGRR